MAARLRGLNPEANGSAVLGQGRLPSVVSFDTMGGLLGVVAPSPGGCAFNDESSEARVSLLGDVSSETMVVWSVVSGVGSETKAGVVSALRREP